MEVRLARSDERLKRLARRGLRYVVTWLDLALGVGGPQRMQARFMRWLTSTLLAARP